MYIATVLVNLLIPIAETIHGYIFIIRCIYFLIYCLGGMSWRGFGVNIKFVLQLCIHLKIVEIIAVTREAPPTHSHNFHSKGARKDKTLNISVSSDIKMMSPTSMKGLERSMYCCRS